MMRYTCVLSFLFVCIVFSANVAAQSEVSSGQFLGKSASLSSLIKNHTIDVLSTKAKRKEEWKEIPNFTQDNPITFPFAKTALPSDGRDPLVRTGRFVDIHGSIDIEFTVEGNRQGEAGVFPPDPEGDNGKNYYIHATNGGGTLLRIYDKQGNVVEGPFSMNVLWQELGVSGLGDPIIMYDHDADRWVLTEFQANNENALLMAVSVTDDPMGEYYAYRFPTPFFPDYPKYGIWHDAYYVSTNENGSDFIPVYAIDRNMALNGEDPTIVRFPGMDKTIINNAVVSQRATPAEWDGDMAPPPGAPHPTLRIYDDGWNGGEDRLEIWEASYNPENPSESSLNGPINIYIDPFDSNLCMETTRDCVCQPESELLMPVIPHVIQNRVQYRNFGDYEMMLLNFPVDINENNVAGIRWVELRKYTGGQWEEYQEGTLATDEITSRFMASIAMDDFGNIALAYTIVDKDSTFLGLRATGRLASDSLGIMTFKETSIVEGGSPSPINRWGDYSSLSVDPVDGTTFWFTGEYMMGNGTWSTKVSKFSIHKQQIDVKPISLNSPQTAPDLSNAETVSANYRNVGLSPQANVVLGLMIDDEVIVEDLIPDSIQVNQEIVHNFSSTADLSAYKDYKFTIYTKLANDENVLNDTLNTNITHLASHDAALISIKNIDPTICGDSLEMILNIQNQGVQNLSFLEFGIVLNGTIYFDQFSGSIEPNGFYEHSFILTGFEEGENTIEVTLANPNNNPDQHPENNTWVDTFNYDPVALRLSLDLETDFYGNEASWTLLNSVNEEVLSENYTESGYAFDQRNVCLPEDCYRFELRDSYGDGWTTAGEPDFEWTDEQGNILAKLISKNFGAESIHEFCIPFECMLSVDAEVLDVSEEGAADGELLIEAFNGIAPILYSIDGGQNFQEEPLFENLSAGEYTIIIQDANACESSVLAEVGTLSSTADAASQILVNIAPNPNQGWFSITVQGLDQYKQIKASLYNSQGIKLYDRSLFNFSGKHKGSFSLKNQAAGPYFIKLNVEESNKLYRVIRTN